MEILLIRHAIAEDRLKWQRTGRDDDERPLINRGRERWQKGVTGLKTVVPSLSLVVSSPLTRARETATILLQDYPGAHYREHRSLCPGSDWKSLMKLLSEYPPDATIAIVGHEPDLSGGIRYFAGPGDDLPDWFKKAGVALITFEGTPARSRGVFKWYRAPGELRKLAKEKSEK